MSYATVFSTSFWGFPSKSTSAATISLNSKLPLSTQRRTQLSLEDALKTLENAVKGSAVLRMATPDNKTFFCTFISTLHKYSNHCLNIHQSDYLPDRNCHLLIQKYRTVQISHHRHTGISGKLL